MSARDIVSDLPTVRVAGDWATFFADDALAALLPAYLPKQRWFGGKARHIRAVRLVDSAPLGATPLPALLLLFELEFTEGPADLYFIPLAMTRSGNVVDEYVLARLTGPHGDAILCDAAADVDTCQRLLSALADGRRFQGQYGVIHSCVTSAFAQLRGDATVPLDVTIKPATSSNTLVFFGQRLLMKLFRRLEEGINPDFEVGRYLTEQATFTRLPRMAGALTYERDGKTFTLAIVQERVANQGDGWSDVLAELAAYYERAAVLDTPSPRVSGANPWGPALPQGFAPLILGLVGPYRAAAERLGRRTAEMHLALAAESGDEAFAAESLTAHDMHAIVTEVTAQARAAEQALSAASDRLPSALADDLARFHSACPQLLQEVEAMKDAPPRAVKTRTHGDFHLGQVLRVDGDFIILDFEGEPTRTVAERREKQSPLRDVAGMLRSLDYAAFAGLFAFTKDHPAAYVRLEPWAELWRRTVSQAFLDGYRSAAAGAAFLPAEAGATERLLRSFVLGKAFYELVYELNNRPDWARIPLRGLLALARESEAAVRSC